MNLLRTIYIFYTVLFLFLLSSGCGGGDDYSGEPKIPAEKISRDIFLFSCVYEIFENGKDIGTEIVETYLLENGNRLIKSEAILDYGYKYQHRAEIYTDAEWKFKSAEVRLHGGGITRLMKLAIEGDVYSCSLSTGDGRVKTYEFPAGDFPVLKYDLAAFDIPLFRYLPSEQARPIELKTLLIEAKTLKAFKSVFKYRYIAEDTIEFKPGTIRAREIIESDHQGQNQKFYWVDYNGVPLSCGKRKDSDYHYRIKEYIRGDKAKAVDFPPGGNQ
ncbi:MAG: hypothetical protein GF307_02945 [candidate division Zixibacteria bacterium]|nr:hypothetical protein [candidate division Zixibacteria bacterium]